MREEIANVKEEVSLDDLFKLTMRKEWKKVCEVYEKHSWTHSAKLTKTEETALHVAVSSYHSERVGLYENYIEKMISCISPFEVLSMPNDKGNTPLHLAASVGWVSICDRIAKRDRKLISVRNAKGETPLFVAAHHGKMQAFLCLHKIYNDKTDQEPDDSLCRRKDGNTILHSAISGEYFRLAHQIICHYPKLVNSVNVDGESPVHFLAKKPNVFKSSARFGFYDSFVYYCMFVHELRLEEYNPRAVKNIYSQASNHPPNYTTCLNIFFLLVNPIFKSFLAGFPGCKKQNGNQTDEENQQQRDHESKMKKAEEDGKNYDFYPPNYTTCVLLFKFAMKVILTVVGVGFWRIKKIQGKKERYSHALQIMNEMIESGTSYKYDSNGQQPDQKMEPTYSGRIELPPTPPSTEELVSHPPIPKLNTRATTSLTEAQINKNNEEDENQPVESSSHYVLDKKDTPLLVAAKMGIPEMVDKILTTFPVAIQDLDSKGKNVLLLAAENRQTSVFDYLLKIKLPEYVFHQVDNEENSILHLAAMLGEDFQPWRIPGAALQMQWEIKWYKHVKRSVPPLCFAHHNSMGETPRKIFRRTHEKLLKEGTDWLIKTSESCSFIAALIATVAFATSATVPGGLKEDSGHPVLENRTAFDVFSISSLIALVLSVTALVFFLAIITSRCQVRDFKANLPNKLLFGLTFLFQSIAAMLVSFCAGHTFILREKLKFAAVPIYAIACLPVSIFAFAQLPLYFDLLKATFRKVPVRSYKVFYQ